MWQRLTEAIGRRDLLERPEFKGGALRSQNRAALNAELNAALSARPSAEWIDILNRAGVPCGPIYKMDQVFADPQVEHLGVAGAVGHPRLGALRLVSQAARLSRTPATLAAAAPEIGAHTDEVLGEIGYGKAEIERLRAERVV